MVQATGQALVKGLKGEPSRLSSRAILLNYLFRYDSLTNNGNTAIEMNPILLERLVKELNFTSGQVFRVYDKLLYDLRGIRKSLGSKYITACFPSARFRRARAYLHRIHRVVPVFDYARAVHNLRVLQALLERRYYWPPLSTQLALVIYITDRNATKSLENRPILQCNIRFLCRCSAYAFHYARNLLQLNYRKRDEENSG